MNKKLGEKWSLTELLSATVEGFDEAKNKGVTLNEREKARYLFAKSLLRKVEAGVVNSL